MPIRRAIGWERLPHSHPASQQDEEERGHCRNGLARAKKHVRPHEQPGRQQTILAAPRRTLHHPAIRRFRAEAEGRHHVGAEIDSQNLNDREGERHPRKREGQIRDQLGDVRRQDVGQELPDVLEDGAAFFDRR